MLVCLSLSLPMGVMAGDEEVKSKIIELKDSLTLKKEQYGTYLGVVSSMKGKELVNGINEGGGSPVVIFTSKNAFCVMKKFSDYTYCVDSKGFIGLGYECNKDNYACSAASSLSREALINKIKMLIQARTKARSLSDAVLYNDLNGVIAALKKGEDPNQKGYLEKPLIFDAVSRSKVLEELIKGGADLKTTYAGDKLITYAASMGNAESIELLVRYGANVNELDEHNATPLMYAILSGVKIKDNSNFKKLLELGANPNIRISFDTEKMSLFDMFPFIRPVIDGGNAADLALLMGNDEMLEVLIEKKVDLSGKTKLGMNPIMLSLVGSNIFKDDYLYTFNHQGVISRLLKEGVSPNISASIDGIGDVSPLVYLTLMKGESRMQIMEELIKNGADVNAHGSMYGVEINSSLPLFVATDRDIDNKEEVINMLKAAGAVLTTSDMAKLGAYEKYREDQNTKIKLMMDSLNLSKSDDSLEWVIADINKVTKRSDGLVKDNIGWCFKTVLLDGTSWCVDSKGDSRSSGYCQSKRASCY